MYKKTTQVPNLILDQYLQTLNGGEFKVLLVIIRQTNGWIDTKTGKRKTRDRISHSQLSLFLIKKGNILLSTEERKGNPRLYFSLRLAHFVPQTIRVYHVFQHLKQNSWLLALLLSDFHVMFKPRRYQLFGRPTCQSRYSLQHNNLAWPYVYFISISFFNCVSRLLRNLPARVFAIRETFGGYKRIPLLITLTPSLKKKSYYSHLIL